jgi:hypothetical protein
LASATSGPGSAARPVLSDFENTGALEIAATQVIDNSERDVTQEHEGRYDFGEERNELGRGGIGRVFSAVERHL